MKMSHKVSSQESFQLQLERHFSSIDDMLNEIQHDEMKLQALESFFNYHFLKLSIRSSNVLGFRKQEYSHLIDFLKYLFFTQDISYLRNIGSKSKLEIENFLILIKDKIVELDHSSKISNIETTINLLSHIGDSYQFIKKYQEKYQDEGIYFFRMLDFRIKHDLSDRDLEILQSRKIVWESKNPQTLEEIGKRFNLSRERVRQIEKKSLRKIWNIINTLSYYFSSLQLQEKYNVDGHLIIDFSSINPQDHTNFSEHFLKKVFSIFLKESHEFLCENEKFNFFIKKSMMTIFDFKGFIEKIDHLLKNATINYSIDFEGMLYQYYRDPENMINQDTIESICQKLLYQKFGIVPDINHQILIRSLKFHNLEDIVTDILHRHQKPMYIDDIYHEIQNKNSNFNHSKGALANYLYGREELISFNRNRIYGLKEWEGHLTRNSVFISIVQVSQFSKRMSGIKVWSDHGKLIVKGGTIINIVLEFLQQFNQPQHIDDIFHEVYKWREITQFKLLSNLKNNQKHFIFYNNEHIGLST